MDSKETLKLYGDAVSKLNSLQTNAKTIALVKNNPDINQYSLPEMRSYLLRVGLAVQSLDSLNAIHVSGTKGKGSTCAFSESILRNNGYTTGLYTSPHLMEVRERIRINGRPLSRQAFTDRFNECWDQLKGSHTPELSMPSYFAFLTLMAYHTFLVEKVDVSIIECGIGGMYDQTNVLNRPVVCGVTSLGIDHVNILGNTLPEISKHKAGIFKPHRPAITTEQLPEAMDVLVEYAKEVEAPLTHALPLTDYTTDSKLELGLWGHHQQYNASLALALSQRWMRWKQTKLLPAFDPNMVGSFEEAAPLTEQTVQGLRECDWPGRAMKVKSGKATYFLDGAHTPESMKCAAEWMRSVRKRGRNVLVFNCVDRSPEDLLKPLLVLHQEQPFDVVLFCPNVASNATQSADNANALKVKSNQLLTPVKNADIWSRMCERVGVNISMCGETQIFSSIQAVKNWVDVEKGGVDAEKLQVFVSGSLHLVGGFLSNLDYEP
eukprot:CFRG7604T1